MAKNFIFFFSNGTYSKPYDAVPLYLTLEATYGFNLEVLIIANNQTIFLRYLGMCAVFGSQKQRTWRWSSWVKISIRTTATGVDGGGGRRLEKCFECSIQGKYCCRDTPCIPLVSRLL